MPDLPVGGALESAAREATEAQPVTHLGENRRSEPEVADFQSLQHENTTAERQSAVQEKPNLNNLPTELIQHVAGYLSPRDVQSMAGASQGTHDALARTDLGGRGTFFKTQLDYKNAMAAREPGFFSRLSDAINPLTEGISLREHQTASTLVEFRGKMQHLLPRQQGKVVDTIIGKLGISNFADTVSKMSDDLQHLSPVDNQKLLAKAQEHLTKSPGLFNYTPLNRAIGALSSHLPAFTEAQRNELFDAVEERDGGSDYRFDGLARGISVMKPSAEKDGYVQRLFLAGFGKPPQSPARNTAFLALATHLQGDLSQDQIDILADHSLATPNLNDASKLTRPLLTDVSRLQPAHLDSIIERGVAANGANPVGILNYRHSIADQLAPNIHQLSPGQHQGLEQIVRSIPNEGDRAALASRAAPSLRLVPDQRRNDVWRSMMGTMDTIRNPEPRTQLIQALAQQRDTLKPSELEQLTDRARQLPEGPARDQIIHFLDPEEA